MVEEIAWDRIRDNLREYLPETHSPRDPAALPFAFSLYDDLHDTYCDLRNGFRLLEAARPEAEAVFHWRLTFWSHWGYRNVDALRVIHSYVTLYLEG